MSLREELGPLGREDEWMGVISRQRPRLWSGEGSACGLKDRMRPLEGFVVAAAVLVVMLGAGTAGELAIGDAHGGLGPSTFPWDQCPPYRASAEMEELLQDSGRVLESRFAGAWVGSDCGVQVAVTDGPVPDALADHPEIRIVERRFSLDRLDDVMETVIERLDPLLATGWDSTTSWPYMAGVTVWDNVVDVQFDPSLEHRREEIEDALADEIAEGTVRVSEYDGSRYRRLVSLYESTVDLCLDADPSWIQDGRSLVTLRPWCGFAVERFMGTGARAQSE